MKTESPTEYAARMRRLEDICFGHLVEQNPRRAALSRIPGWAEQQQAAAHAAARLMAAAPDLLAALDALLAATVDASLAAGLELTEDEAAARAAALDAINKATR